MAQLRAPRVDADGVAQAPVAHAADYSIEVVLYHRAVAGGLGTILCRQLRSSSASRSGRRGPVQLVANYIERGVETERVVQCVDESDEARQLERLERIIREASARPFTG